MYKGTSLNNQGRADRITMRDMPSSDDHLTVEERREFIKERMKAVEVKILALPEDDPERKRMGRQKHQLQLSLNALRAEPKRPNLGHYFTEVAHRHLPLETYEQLMDEARHVYDLRNKAETERKATQQRLQAEMIERASE